MARGLCYPTGREMPPGMQELCVLLPILPRWSHKIIDRDKAIEIRKNRPKLPTPFKCYLYMSSGGWAWRDPFSTAVIPPNGKMYCGAQRVIAEFVCDWIDEYAYGREGHYCMSWNDLEASKLTFEELERYGKGKKLYGWHISDLKVYDKPKQLSQFGLSRAPQSWCYVKEVAA